MNTNFKIHELNKFLPKNILQRQLANPPLKLSPRGMRSKSAIEWYSWAVAYSA